MSTEIDFNPNDYVTKHECELHRAHSIQVRAMEYEKCIENVNQRVESSQLNFEQLSNDMDHIQKSTASISETMSAMNIEFISQKHRNEKLFIAVLAILILFGVLDGTFLARLFIA